MDEFINVKQSKLCCSEGLLTGNYALGQLDQLEHRDQLDYRINWTTGSTGINCWINWKLPDQLDYRINWYKLSDQLETTRSTGLLDQLV